MKNERGWEGGIGGKLERCRLHRDGIRGRREEECSLNSDGFGEDEEEYFTYQEMK